MENRRVFRRLPSQLPIIVVTADGFVYGRMVDFGLGGACVQLESPLSGGRVDLTPNRFHRPGEAVIPLPYEVAWAEQEGLLCGLTFKGSSRDFWRSWLAEAIPPGETEMLDHRQLVRVPSQVRALLCRDGDWLPCTVVDVSLGGACFVASDEFLPGELVELNLDESAELSGLELILLRVEELQGKFLCGGKFLGLTDDNVQALQHNLAERLRGLRR